MLNLGDFTTSETIYVPFATYDSNGASVTITGLATTDIEIYKDGSVTQRSSDNGYALLDTDGIDFDGVTGLHGFSVDLSDDTDSGFYANGSQFWLAVIALTVQTQTVSFVYYFTIGRYLKPTTAGQTLDATDILTTALTEAYATDGSTATLSQLLYQINAFLQEKSISGTTMTVKKIDGSTTAMTFTLSDASDPTSITRAS